MGPLLRAQLQFRFLLVVKNYFTKWVEAVPLSDVTRQQIVKFLWQNIVCCFGLPHTVISDNGTNFASRQVASFCSKYKITHRFSTPTIHKAMTRPRSATTLSLTACARVLIKRKASRWRNSPGCYGRTGLTSASQRVRLFSHWLMGRRPSSLSTSACSHFARENRSGLKRHPTLSCPRSIGGETTGGSDTHYCLPTTNQGRTTKN